jgi:hypothetical protein
MSLALQLRKLNFRGLESLAQKTSGWLTVKFLITERNSVDRRVQPTSEMWYWVFVKKNLRIYQSPSFTCVSKNFRALSRVAFSRLHLAIIRLKPQELDLLSEKLYKHPLKP